MEFAESRANITKAADLVVNGTLVETKLSLYGKVGLWWAFLFLVCDFWVDDFHGF